MKRLNIFEIIKEEYDIDVEFGKIQHLFYHSKITLKNKILRDEKELHLEEFVNKYLLHQWKQRQSYIECMEIRNKIDENLDNRNEYTINDIITLSEFFSNIIFLIQTKKIDSNIYTHWNEKYYMLRQNIDLLIEKLNYQKCTIEEEEKVLLIPQKPETTTVAEISEKETALAILKYNHLSLKGDLDEKRKLLYQIALEYEPLLKTPIENYKDFFKKTNELLNTLHIRHNNITKENNKNNVINLATEELENLYDELYQLLLFCILIKDNTDRKNRVANFLQKIKEKLI